MKDREPRYSPDKTFYDQHSLAERLLNDMHTEEGDRDEWMHIYLPRSSFGEWVLDRGFNHEAITTLGMNRLSQIRQLSFLSYRFPLPDDAESNILIEYTHTRFEHSVLTGLLMEKVLKRNRFADTTVNLGKTAGFVHDVGMPALGDATKTIDPIFLDEEKHWTEAVSGKGLTFLGKEGISPDTISEALQNKGTVGKLLDIVDRISYTAYDLGETLGMLWAMDNPRYYDLYRLFHEDHTLGNVYRDVNFDESSQEFYFNDPHRLGRFLQARALLHYSLYRNPYSAGRDRLFSRFVEPFYSRTEGDPARPLTPQVLRKMVDDDLLTFLGEKYKTFIPFFGTEFRKWQPAYREVSEEENPADIAREITTQGNYVIDTITMSGFQTGTDYLTKDDNGAIRPFSEVDIKLSRELDTIEQATEGTYVFYADLNESNEVNRIIRDHLIPYREKRITLPEL